MAIQDGSPKKTSGNASPDDHGAGPAQIHWRLPQWFPELSKDQLEKMLRFHSELLKANRTVDLISQRTLPAADLIHFADSILASRVIQKVIGAADLTDIGSGCGFPGLIYALLFPQSKVKLVESDSRKVDFTRQMISQLGLSNVSVSVQSLESLPAGSIQFGVSRGLSTVAKSILLARRPFKVGGVYFHIKGEEWSTEISQIPSQLCSIWQPGVVSDYKLPIGEARMFVIKTDKLIA